MEHMEACSVCPLGDQTILAHGAVRFAQDRAKLKALDAESDLGCTPTHAA